MNSSNAEVFDVFLCHNSEDKPAVREIAQKLVKEGIKPWLDIEQIPPGASWQTELGEQINSIKSAAVFVGNRGIGPWQNEEIQAFLSQFMERKCPVIPTILGSADTMPELPWTLKNRHRVDFRVSDPTRSSNSFGGITRQKPAARENLIPGKDELATSKRTSFEPRHSPPLAHLSDQDQIGQLEILRRRVKEYWVDGVLKHSLHNEVLISLGKRPADEFVDAPWKYAVEVSDALNSAPLEDRDVKVIYDATGLLLILGEPGGGKTTTLLDLAGTLLERARIDINERIPIIVNLSNWKKKQPLAQWIAVELSEKYRVPVKIGRSWLEEGYLLPLLDGLDEVSTALQPDCVTAVNAYIDEFNPSGLVVCCRLNEYRWLPERLKLNGAICLEALDADEVADYLKRARGELAALRQAIASDSALRELARTPLMLSIMSLAFLGGGADELVGQKGGSPKVRRKQIFRLYVEQMFQRKGTMPSFRKGKTVTWLSWLAGKMKEQSESVFLVEGLQPGWLGTRAQRLAYGTVVALSVGLVFGAIYALGSPGGKLRAGLISGVGMLVGVALGCWSESPLRNGFKSGLIVGLTVGLSAGLIGLSAELIVGLSAELSAGLVGGLVGGLFGGLLGGSIGGLGVGSLKHIGLVETMSWRWNRFWKRTIPGLIVGLIVGLLNGTNALNRLTLGLAFGATCGLISGLVGGFTDAVKAGKASPNQGIKLSRQNALVTSLACFPVGLIWGLIEMLLTGEELRAALATGLAYGLLGGLIGGLNRGGSAVIKHYALRLTLWLKGYTPFNFIKFLDHCAKLIFLKKVGGGYIFIHRMLLDYFADMNTQSTRAEKGTKGSVGR
jgi:eukaryotic-like serine/threonine-protein kinase